MADESTEPFNYAAKSKVHQAARVKRADSAERRKSRSDSMKFEVGGPIRTEKLRKSIERDGKGALLDPSTRHIYKDPSTRRLGKQTSGSMSVRKQLMGSNASSVTVGTAAGPTHFTREEGHLGTETFSLWGLSRTVSGYYVKLIGPELLFHRNKASKTPFHRVRVLEAGGGRPAGTDKCLPSLHTQLSEVLEESHVEGALERRKIGRSGRKALEHAKKEQRDGRNALLAALPHLRSSSAFFHVSYIALDASFVEVFGSAGGVGLLLSDEASAAGWVASIRQNVEMQRKVERDAAKNASMALENIHDARYQNFDGTGGLKIELLERLREKQGSTEEGSRMSALSQRSRSSRSLNDLHSRPILSTEDAGSGIYNSGVPKSSVNKARSPSSVRVAQLANQRQRTSSFGSFGQDIVRVLSNRIFPGSVPREQSPGSSTRPATGMYQSAARKAAGSFVARTANASSLQMSTVLPTAGKIRASTLTTESSLIRSSAPQSSDGDLPIRQGGSGDLSPSGGSGRRGNNSLRRKSLVIRSRVGFKNELPSTQLEIMRNLETPIGDMREEIIKTMRKLPMMEQSRAGTAIYEELANAFAKVSPERGQVFIEENESANREFIGV